MRDRLAERGVGCRAERGDDICGALLAARRGHVGLTPRRSGFASRSEAKSHHAERDEYTASPWPDENLSGTRGFQTTGNCRNGRDLLRDYWDGAEWWEDKKITGKIPPAFRRPDCVDAADRILALTLTPSRSRDDGPSISDAFRAGEGAKQAFFCSFTRGLRSTAAPLVTARRPCGSQTAPRDVS
jgi:hypothetical protein